MNSIMLKIVLTGLISVAVLSCNNQETSESQRKDGIKPSAESGPTMPLSYEHLKELEWLVGKWEDKGDGGGIRVTSTYEWDQEKNFLLQQFTVKKENKKTLEGKQIIAFDPIRMKIRSWIFNSEGGFGESFWSREGNSWYSVLAFTTGDGRVASATHVYTKIDSDHYTFASFARSIDGKILPNIDPIMETRVK